MTDDTGFDTAPARYATPQGEAIDIIRKELGDVGFIYFCVGTARKYELRAGKKEGATRENDLEKARWYREMSRHVGEGGPDPRSQRRS